MGRRDGTALMMVGASVRAAVWSACRADRTRVFAMDLYGDADLRRMATDARVITGADDEATIAEQSARWPAGPWLYTGSWENEPAAIRRLQVSRRLLGNGPETLSRVRDPFWLAEFAATQGNGLLMPEMTRDALLVPTDGTWLVKAYHSGGGLGVTRYRGESPGTEPVIPRYFQRCCEGVPYSVQYVAARGLARILGVTQALPALSGAEFLYAGSFGPCRLTLTQRDRLRAFGQALARDAGLCGLFGIDLLIADDAIRLLEVNPRYTAAMEVLERALGFSAIDRHIRACMDEELPDQDLDLEWNWDLDLDREPDRKFWAKRIVYAPSDGIAPDWSQSPPDFLIADHPAPGTPCAAGTPLWTVMASGRDWDSCALRLNAAIEGSLQRI